MKIMKRTIKVEEYYLICPICRKEIKGRSNNQVAFNFGLHEEKHKNDNTKNK